MLDNKSSRFLKKLMKSEKLTSAQINSHFDDDYSTERLYGGGYIKNINISTDISNPYYQITEKGIDAIQKYSERLKSTTSLVFSIISIIGVVTGIIFGIMDIF